MENHLMYVCYGVDMEIAALFLFSDMFPDKLRNKICSKNIYG